MSNLKAHSVLVFSSYVQAHEEYINSMGSRTKGDISFCPTGKSQVGHYLQSDIWKKAKQEPIDIARDAHGSHRKVHKMAEE